MERNGKAERHVISVVGVIKPLPVRSMFGIKGKNSAGPSKDDENYTGRGHGRL